MSLTANAIDEIANEAAIQHYGVLGMKWGKRKDRSSKSASRAKRKRNAGTPQYHQAKRIKAKPRSKMTNRELQTLTKRQTLESQYSKLNPSVVAKGSAIFGSLLATAGVGFKLYDMYNKPAAKKAREMGVRFWTQFKMRDRMLGS